MMHIVLFDDNCYLVCIHLLIMISRIMLHLLFDYSCTVNHIAVLH